MISKAQIEDSSRGIMWEHKWRGTLEEFPNPELLDSSIWGSPPKVSHSVKSVGWPANKVGLGTYGWKYRPEIIEKAVELGASIIDTAEGYGFGRVETALGSVLKGLPSEATWIASKVARNHLSFQATLQAGRRSRDRLGRAIDLYQIHWPSPTRDFQPTLDAMAKLLEEGVIKRVGVCNFCGGQLARAMELSRERGFEIESNQIRFNLVDRVAKDYLIPLCNRLGVRVIAYSPLGQGGCPLGLGEVLPWVDYAIPATNSLDHLKENLALNEKALS